VVTPDSVELFIQKSQMDDAALQYLGNTINIRPYDTFFSYLKQLPSQLKLDEASVRGCHHLTLTPMVMLLYLPTENIDW
jgi:hypothetical protein